MKSRGAVLAALSVLVALGVLVPLGLVVVPAEAASPKVTASLATKTPTAGRAFVVTGTAPGKLKRSVRLEVRSEGRWVRLTGAKTGSRGGYRLTATLRSAGVKKIRVVAPAVRRHRTAVSRIITFTLRTAPKPPAPPVAPKVPTHGCTPGTSGTAADEAAAGLIRTLSDWRTRKVMAIGQQVNISSDEWARVLDDLAPSTVGLIGFDFDELEQAADRGKDFLPDLIAKAEDHGAVLTGSWHARNPWTGGPYNDRNQSHRLAELLDETTPAGSTFWAAWDDEVAGPLGRLRDAGIPVILRPLHEAGGDWFWWGNPDPGVYRALWAKAQQRAATAGLQNVVWSYGAAPRTRAGILDPLTLLPACAELGGLDTYDPENGDPTDRVNLTDYTRLAAKLPFFGLSEVGPFSSDGSWNPAVITNTLKAQKLYASYAMLWFDDSDGKKALRSLNGGPEWLASCSAASGAAGFCKLG